jgi:hypothetical protein
MCHGHGTSDTLGMREPQALKLSLAIHILPAANTHHQHPQSFVL